MWIGNFIYTLRKFFDFFVDAGETGHCGIDLLPRMSALLFQKHKGREREREREW
jgi:hypothetical protein